MELISRRDILNERSYYNKSVYEILDDNGAMLTAVRFHYYPWRTWKTFWLMPDAEDMEKAVEEFLGEECPPECYEPQFHYKEKKVEEFLRTLFPLEFGHAVFERRHRCAYAPVIQGCAGPEQAMWCAENDWENFGHPHQKEDWDTFLVRVGDVILRDWLA